MPTPIIDVGLFSSGKYNAIDPSSEIKIRRALALSHLAKSTFHPIPLQDTLRGVDKLKPKAYQLLPLDSFLTPWLSSLKLPKENILQHKRETLIVGDEGGMGKTYASVLVAHRYLSENQSGTVVVLCPPLLGKQWQDEFARLGYRARFRSAHHLISGELQTGGVMIVSKFSPMRNPLISEDSKKTLRKKVELCILDEGHEGMIAGGSDENALMRNGIREVMLNCKRRLIATATPIRNNQNDLKALITSCLDEDEPDFERINSFDFSPEWYGHLRGKWLPLLEKLYDGSLDSDGIKTITELAIKMIPFLDDGQKILLQEELEIQLADISKDKIKRIRLARDLHPLGKYFSISVRDDLGKEEVEVQYRKQTSQTFRYEQPEGFKKTKKIVNGFGKSSWSSCFNSCPLNSVNSRYLRTFPSLIENSGITKETLQNLWLNDPRLEEILVIKKSLEQNSCLNEKVGIVVFCEWSGTVDCLEQWADSQVGFNAYKLRGIDVSDGVQYANQNDNSDEQKRHRSEQFNILSKLHNESQYAYGEPINILICGPGVTVGHNMQWANRAIHWDINFGSVENIAQKTWRLDRLVKGGVNTGGNTENISTEFEVNYFVSKDDAGKIAEANKKHQLNRLFLGDRRYTDYENQEYPILIPECGKKFETNETWNSSPKLIDFSDFEMQRFWEIVEGKGNNVPGISEALGLHFLSIVTGISLDLSNCDEIKADHEDGIGVTDSTFHDLITLADITERGSLQFLRGGYLESKNSMSRFGPASELPSLVLNLNPDGKLITRFAKYLRDYSQKSDELMSTYAFVITKDKINNIDQIPDFDKDLRIGVDLRIIELKENSGFWPLLKKFYGTNCPSGLIIRLDDEDWAPVTVSKLNMPGNKYSALIEHVLENIGLNYSSEIPNIQYQSDKGNFDKITYFESLLDPLDRSNFDNDDNKWLSAITRISGDLNKMLEFKTQYKEKAQNHFLPLIQISKTTYSRKQCPECESNVKDCDLGESCDWSLGNGIGWN